jgi:alkylated DNA repair protein (DNA oxidative demethylase)
VNGELFDPPAEAAPTLERIGDAAFVLRGHALACQDPLLAALQQVEAQAPFRHMTTPNGFEMSVAMTNCGTLGWTTDRRGYRYTRQDPLSGRDWPALPEVFLQLARSAAAAAGFDAFTPDACLINRYTPGARLSLHQDKDERDYAAPIVSVSLGIPATFLFGGHSRTDKTRRIPLVDGDVVVWGGPDRLRYHGVLPLKEADHPRLGAQRINLTFRQAG